MTDPLDRILRPPDIEPLAPPTGHYVQIVHLARRRRRQRAAGASVLSAALVAGVVGGSALLTGAGPGSAAPAVGTSPSVSPSPASSPLSSPQPSRSASASSPVGPRAAVGPVPPGFRPSSVTYVSASTGYLLGDAPCPRPVCTSLVRTVDGEFTWQGVPAPRAPLSTSGAQPGHVRDVRFADPQDGWVFGGALYATHDAAAHWTEVALPGQVTELETDGSTAYALIASCGADGSCRGYRLYQSPVGTDRWRPVPGVSAASATGGSLAISGRHGVLALVGAVWARRGGSWVPAAAVPCRGGLPVSAVAASAAGARLVAFCGEGAAGSLYLSPWVSDDAGASWQPVADGSARAVGGTLSVAAATDRLLLVASGNPSLGGSLLRSADGGRTFAAVNLPAAGAGWSYVGARSATALLALPGTPDGSQWYSDDGGLTWRPHRFG